MPVVIGETKYECIDTEHAEQFEKLLTESEGMDGVTRDGITVMVPRMDVGGAFEIADLGVEAGHMTDEDAARVVADTEAAINDPERHRVL